MWAGNLEVKPLGAVRHLRTGDRSISYYETTELDTAAKVDQALQNALALPGQLKLIEERLDILTEQLNQILTRVDALATHITGTAGMEAKMENYVLLLARTMVENKNMRKELDAMKKLLQEMI